MQRNGQPLLILTCQHDSHSFEERTIVVNDVIKVGRAVARSKATPTNAIFDCKVLSRNHAVLWFTSDEFWLRDTNSSNGTFVNNTRVSKKDDSDSCDRQIFSGDVIRFGVDVVENDTTHGCIIASVTLFLPNGQEAKPKLGHTGDALPSGHISINNEQLFQISCFLNDIVFREQGLDKKLDTLRQALQQASIASELGWQAMVNEEKLLQRLELYERQIRVLRTDLPEGALKAQVADLLQEKNLQETTSKAQLAELLKDKEGALQRVRDLELTIAGVQEECTHLREEFASAQEARTSISDEYKASLTTISQRLNELTTEKNQLNEQLAKATQHNEELCVQVERITCELEAAKATHDSSYHHSLVKGGLVNGVAYAEAGKDANVVRPIPLPNNDLVYNGAEDIDMVVGDSFVSSCPNVNSRKSEELISDSILDFHRGLKLIRLLDAKIGHGPTTDLDADSHEVDANPSESTSDTTMAPAAATNGVSSLSASNLTTTTSALDALVKCILHHGESGMTNLQAYLHQANPTAADELMSMIQTGNPEIDLDLHTVKRPRTLNLPGNGSPPTSLTDSEAADEGVAVVGADSLNTSPAVSSANGVLSSTTSLDAEEMAHLREAVRLANYEIERHKAHIALLETTAMCESEKSLLEGDTNAVALTSEEDLQEMRAECEVLRARIGDIEDQMAQTRDNHRRLVEETRQHREEVEQLRAERQHLQAALAKSEDQVSRLEAAQNHPEGGGRSHISSSNDGQRNQQQLRVVSTTTLGSVSNVFMDEESIEIPSPRRLVTTSSLTAIPLMLLVFAVMFAIFSKFVS